MPFYTYKCSEHGQFDVFQRMNDEHAAQCPKCGRNTVQILYPSALHNLPSSDQRMGKTREELFQNLGKEGLADRDMWKYDKWHREETFHGS
jgi:putative FmdB family regulatory protein